MQQGRMRIVPTVSSSSNAHVPVNQASTSTQTSEDNGNGSYRSSNTNFTTPPEVPPTNPCRRNVGSEMLVSNCKHPKPVSSSSNSRVPVIQAISIELRRKINRKIQMVT